MAVSPSLSMRPDVDANIWYQNLILVHNSKLGGDIKSIQGVSC
jgi:hypothetical protein